MKRRPFSFPFNKWRNWTTENHFHFKISIYSIYNIKHFFNYISRCLLHISSNINCTQGDAFNTKHKFYLCPWLKSSQVLCTVNKIKFKLWFGILNHRHRKIMVKSLTSTVRMTMVKFYCPSLLYVYVLFPHFIIVITILSNRFISLNLQNTSQAHSKDS